MAFIFGVLFFVVVVYYGRAATHAAKTAGTGRLLANLTTGLIAVGGIAVLALDVTRALD